MNVTEVAGLKAENNQNTLNFINMNTLKLQRVTRYFGYILLAVVLFQSCTIEAHEQRKEEPKKEVERKVLKNSDFEIVVIDSCEYVVFDRVHGYAGSGGICHKQNCKYCAERSKHNRYVL